MNDLKTLDALARELGMVTIKHAAARFGPFTQPRAPRGGYQLTKEEADRIRAHYAAHPPTFCKRVRRKITPLVRIVETPTNAPEHVISVICRHYGISVERLKSREKGPQVVYARITAAALFERLGYNPAESGRFLVRDHSTVLHELRRAHGTPHARGRTADLLYSQQIMTEVDILAVRLFNDPDYQSEFDLPARSFDDLLADATRFHPQGRAVAAYVRAVVRPGKPQSPTMLYHGLVTLTRDAKLRARVQTMLARLDQPGVVHIMALHAEKLGFRWEAAS